jgi:chromosome segregation ATPase
MIGPDRELILEQLLEMRTTLGRLERGMEELSSRMEKLEETVTENNNRINTYRGAIKAVAFIASMLGAFTAMAIELAIWR